MPDVERRVVMSRAVARRWVSRVAHAEYRFQIFLGQEGGKLPGLLHSFRDRKAGLEGVPAIPDLGLKEHFEAIEVWSSDHDALVKLAGWFEKRGYETTGVW